jgi:hypothetical protein
MKRIHHLRSKNFQGGVTVITTYDSAYNTTTIQYSICSINDNYNKQLGITLANDCLTPFTVPGELATENQVVSILLTYLSEAERNLAVKSILYSMAGRKLTPTLVAHFRGCYQSRQQDIAIAAFIQRTNALGNRTSLKEINLLYSLIPHI